MVNHLGKHRPHSDRPVWAWTNWQDPFRSSKSFLRQKSPSDSQDSQKAKLRANDEICKINDRKKWALLKCYRDVSGNGRRSRSSSLGRNSGCLRWVMPGLMLSQFPFPKSEFQSLNGRIFTKDLDNFRKNTAVQEVHDLNCQLARSNGKRLKWTIIVYPRLSKRKCYQRTTNLV